MVDGGVSRRPGLYMQAVVPRLALGSDNYRVHHAVGKRCFETHSITAIPLVTLCSEWV